MHIALLSSSEWTDTVKPALEAAGANLKLAVMSEAQKLEALTVAKYPALVDAFKAGFADVENGELKGVAKMEKVVEDIIPQVPAIAGELSSLSNLKDFLLGLGQTLFIDTITTLETEAKTVIDKIL